MAKNAVINHWVEILQNFSLQEFQHFKVSPENFDTLSNSKLARNSEIYMADYYGVDVQHTHEVGFPFATAWALISFIQRNQEPKRRGNGTEAAFQKQLNTASFSLLRKTIQDLARIKTDEQELGLELHEETTSKTNDWSQNPVQSIDMKTEQLLQKLAHKMQAPKWCYSMDVGAWGHRGYVPLTFPQIFM